jgi:hypothetical protein
MKKTIASVMGLFIALLMVSCSGGKDNSVSDVEEVTTVSTSIVTTVETSRVTTSSTALTTTPVTSEVTTSVTTEAVVETEAEKLPEQQTYDDPEPVKEKYVEPSEEKNPEPVEEYLVYKPSTKYLHKNTCRWNCGDAERIDSVEGIELRICEECNPEAEGYIPYEPPTASECGISDYDYTLLCKVVASEAGGLNLYERSCIVASVINQRDRMGLYIEECLYISCVPWGFCPWNDYFCGGSVYYADMSDAVDYYFAHVDTEFAYWDADSWWGDGSHNNFYRALYD